MVDKSGEQNPAQTGVPGQEPGDDLSHLFGDEGGQDVILSVTDETLRFLHSAFASDPAELDSFLSLNFFSFG